MRNKLKPLLTLSLLSTLLLNNAQAAPTIVGGQITNKFPTTLWIHVWYADFASPSMCSGVLVGPRFALTMGHCVDNTSYGTPAAIYVGFQTQVPNPVSTDYANPYAAGTEYYQVYDWAYIPNPTNSDERDTNRDIGALLLQTLPSKYKPAYVLSDPLLTGEHEGTPGNAVGYGLSSAAVYNTAGVKRVAPLTIDVVEASYGGVYQSEYFSWEFASSTEGSGCGGDSGGPVYYSYVDEATKPVVMGLIKGGDSRCHGTSYALNVGEEYSWLYSVATSWGVSINWITTAVIQ